jgi:hypothetical protein
MSATYSFAQPREVPAWNELAAAREQSLAAREQLAEDSAECACGAAEEVAKLTIKLARANALLKIIRRVDPKPSRPENALDDDPNELAVIGYAAAIATIRARIDLYLQARS